MVSRFQANADEYPIELVRQQPDFQRGLLALIAATEALESAQVFLDLADHQNAFIAAKNSMRFSSSALLFRDGYVATTLVASVDYLNERYPEIVPAERWYYFEAAFAAQTPGIIGFILRLLGKEKAINEKNTKAAFIAAENFLNSAQAIIDP